MSQEQSSTGRQDAKKQQPSATSNEQQTGGPHNPNTPKTESSSEYEGATDRENTGNKPVEVKTETSSSSGQ